MEQVQETPKNIVAAANVVDKQKRRRTRTVGIFSAAMITKRVPLSIVHIGDNIKQALEKKISFEIEGKCIVEGYVKPGSCRVQSYSSGELSSSDVMFDVVIECEVCSPVEGMHIDCIAKNITESAGIKAETEEEPSPVVIYIARDHHFTNSNFSNVKPGDKIKVRVIGQRYELNDSYISVIAELIEDRAAKYGKKKKLVIKD
uniref:S1 motif domain-containing protein n=1 Tax=viral metagenome TaxID=1070528 RepID=A0A6C0LHV8_9ZZZZ